MDVEQRDELYTKVAKLEKAGDWAGVLETLKQIAGLRLPDLERCIALVNIGTTYGHLNDPSGALKYFDQAIDLESKHNRFSCLEHKAVFLASQNRFRESLRIYRELMERKDLYLADLQRFQQNAQLLEQNDTSTY